jgi:hypothetical protein
METIKNNIELISVILAFISVIVAFGTIGYNAYTNRKQGRVLKEQTEKMNESLDGTGKMLMHLNRQAEDLKEQTKKMETASKEINQIIVNLETRHVEPFPDNFDVIDNLLSYCEQDTPAYGRKGIEIFTDVAGYGILSKHSNFQKFNEKIKRIINQGQVEIFWCFYTGTLRNKCIERQFHILKNNPQELKKYIGKCLSNAPHLCKEPQYPNCRDREKCFVRHIHDAFAKKDIAYDDIVTLAKILQGIEEENIELLTKQAGTKLKIRKLEKEDEVLPYFGWFVYEERSVSKPVQAMISFPIYAENREEGLITKHKGIIEAFQSKLPQYKREVKEVCPDRDY